MIPKKIRREAGLKPGIPLEVRWREGLIEIEPASLPVTLTKRGRLLVAIPQKEVGPLRAETVEQTRRRVRREGIHAPQMGVAYFVHVGSAPYGGAATMRRGAVAAASHAAVSGYERHTMVPRHMMRSTSRAEWVSRI